MNHLLTLIFTVATVALTLGADFVSNTSPIVAQRPSLAGAPTDYPVIGRVCSRSS